MITINLPQQLFDEPASVPARLAHFFINRHIDTNTYTLSAQHEVEIKGEISVVAFLEAATEPENHAVWEKALFFILRKVFISTERSSCRRIFCCRFSQYAYAEEIIEKTGFNHELQFECIL